MIICRRLINLKLIRIFLLNEKILITGSRGFIGNSLKLKLIESGYEVIDFDKSIGNNIEDKNCFKLYENEEIFFCFHLAGNTYIPDSWNKTFDFYYINIIGTENVLEFLQKKENTFNFRKRIFVWNTQKITCI